MRNRDQRRPPLPVRLTRAERDFYVELRRLVDAAGLSFRALEESTSSARSDSGESSFYSKSQWGRWLNGQSLPPRKAVRKLAEKLAKEDIEAEHLVDLWGRAFVPTPYPQEPGVTPVRPRQLPIAAQHFMGRAAQLEILTPLADQVTASSSATVIVIEGTAGVGKTTLANHLGHLVGDRFPDGQLYVSMRGFDEGGEPMRDGEALRGFLEAFGIPPKLLPVGVDDQAALYRSLLADKRVLVVLDNVRDASQVRRLLPGSPGCLVLVTSRNQLTGLAAEGAHVLRLDPFTMSEARDLLARRLGSWRVQREPQAADELIGCCARLPLAMSVAAAYAAAHPDFPLEVLANEFRSRGLDLLDTGDPATTTRTVFSTSYHHLSEGAARMFRLLGIHAGPDISLLAAASLAAIAVEQARKVLDELARAYLVEEHLPGRFAFHDLLHAYAAERARAQESIDELDAAMRRLLDHYLRTMYAGVMLVYSARLPIELPPPISGMLAESFATDKQAMAWCQAERHVIQALVTNAAERGGFDAYCWQIPWAMAPLLARGCLWHDYLASQRIALAAAQNLKDAVGLGHAHYEFAHACALLGEVASSDTHLKQALELFTELGDLAAVAMTRNGMAQLLEQQGRYLEAVEHEKEALRLRNALGNRIDIAHSEQTIGSIYARLGRYDDALRHCRRALDLGRETGSRMLTADTSDILGFIYLGLDDHDNAISCYQRALAFYRENGDMHVAAVLTGLGDAQLAAGDADAARDSWQQALTVLNDLPNADDQPVKARLAQLG
ncbi:MAG TPA: tetratricopeptide repeat protein [Actinocrinis sp.]|uniref:ATP-binding protein n=1 Tax=Actinocrinis sp. TaxID=1920516 RepID=UPI002DDD4BF8|nr:tetratricopeptide repeat protein [Actinocrinis sp.]HEV2936732.1 tetratricopeptide repeat protein [Streptosporangiaceae bacterium]HEV3169755.1 tetratricopeptide repeat protein [Actinocrinis sp.]